MADNTLKPLLVIEDNPGIQKGIRGIPDIFTSFYATDSGGKTFGYRPLVRTTFAIEMDLTGINPGITAYGATNPAHATVNGRLDVVIQTGKQRSRKENADCEHCEHVAQSQGTGHAHQW